jgi:hypothetical protein
MFEANQSETHPYLASLLGQSSDCFETKYHYTEDNLKTPEEVDIMT